MPENAPPTRRRLIRYSLRTLLLIVTLFCVGLGLYVKRQRDRYLAIEKIKFWGGEVEFLERQPSKTPGDRRVRLDAVLEAYQSGQPRPEFAEARPQGTPWMRSMLGKYGKYHGSRVVRITLGRTVFSPEDTDIDIRVLAPLDEVKQLTLTDSITDDDLIRLPNLPELEFLHLAMLDEITDRGLVCLDRLPNLQRLQLMYGSFTAEGLSHLRSNQKLTALMLHGCELTDDSLAHLVDLPLLTDLWLEESTVSDAAIPHLSQLHRLKMLRLGDSNFTAKGVRRLREALPNCRIEATFDDRGGSRARVLTHRRGF